MTSGLELARWVIAERRPEASWPRAAAILLRQHLEAAMDRQWAANGWPAMAQARLRHQLIALPLCTRRDEHLAADVRHVWARLTRACHGGTYELQPTREQLLDWADVLARFDQIGLRQDPTDAVTAVEP